MLPRHKRSITKEQLNELLQILKERFSKNNNRHANIQWSDVEAKLLFNKDKLAVVYAMETSGGEPDVVDYDKKNNCYIIMDCSAESPGQRRSLCYDEDALNQRKENKPLGSAMEMAKDIGAEILTEEQYRYLQTMGKFDCKTSCWIKTPDKIRKLGGALFCDRRFDTVFVYHNGVQSYYGGRGFRTYTTI